MKVKFGCLLAAFLAVLFGRVHAQVQLPSIQGKVLTETHSPAEAATIILLKSRDSSVVGSTIIGKNGKFRFDEVPVDSYLLLVTSVGYNKVYDGPYVMGEDQHIKLPDIILQPVSNQLKEVTVSSTRPEVEVKPGKITINIPNSLTAEGSSALDILRTSPGVRVDNSNNINIIGRQAALITIDGKPTNLSGDDLASYLRSLQSNMIEKIELITSGSARYDSSAGGIVNIVLKKGNNIGTNGSVSVTAGYGKYYKSNTGITFNDRTDKLNFFGGYTFTADKTFHDFTSDRLVNYDGLNSDYHVDYQSVQRSINNSFNAGLDYYLTPNHTIGVLIGGFSRNDKFTKNNGLDISNNGHQDSVIEADSKVNRQLTRINYNLNYNGKLDKKGTTLSGDLSYTSFNRSSSEYITNYFYSDNGSQYRDPLLLENLSPSKINIWLSKIDFSTPFSATAKFDAGLKFSHVTSNNTPIFGPLVENSYIPDPSLSTPFHYTENLSAGYVNYQNKFKKFNLNLGLRAEETNTESNSGNLSAMVSRNYLSLFPQFQLTYKKNDKNDFSISYNRGITRPLYEQLNPFLYYVDLYDYTAGNPNLKPQYSNAVELSHIYNKTIITTLYTSIISNSYDFGVYDQNDSSKVSINTHKNFGKIYNFGVKFSAPVIFTSWWNAYFHVDASYQRYIAYPQNGNLNKGTQDIIFSSIQNFKISSTLNAVIGGEYESPNFYGINQNKARYMVNAGIGKQLFNKRGNLRLSVNDVFNTLRDRGHIDYQNVNMTVIDKRESQIARLTFNYRFGKTTVKGVDTRRNGNEEEQKRIGSGGGN